jgi:hypothetical protein
MMAALAEAGLIRAEVTGNANREGGDARNAYFTDPELKKLYINPHSPSKSMISLS